MIEPDHKRLFIFAGFDKSAEFKHANRYYLQSLSRLGDIILIMDNDGEIPSDITSLCLYTRAIRHGEYDFGSYKRGFFKAKDLGILERYDCLYLVNDSVIGPVKDLEPVLSRLESSGGEAWGLAYTIRKHGSHLQSWFLGMKKSLFSSAIFEDFISGVRRAASKSEICLLYENGFTDLLTANHIEFNYLLGVRRTYNHPERLFREGLPFFKRDSIYRHNASLSRQIKYILDHCDPRLKEAVETDLKEEGNENLITSSRAVNGARYARYLFSKIFG